MIPRIRTVVATTWLIAVSIAVSPSPAAAQGRMTGKRLPPLNVGTVIQGSASDLGTWGDGKVYVVDLWGTWCLPCIANIPKLTALQATYKSRGLVVIGYSWEKPEILRAFAKKQGDRMRYVIVSDPDEVTLKQLTALEAVQSFPYAYLVDRKGAVVWEGHPEDNDLPGAVARLMAPEKR